MKTLYQLLNSSLLMGEEEKESKLYFKWNNKKVYYITTDLDGSNHQYFESTKHPEELSDEERYRVLNYCLSDFYKDEIVNYNDLFLQNEFIIESILTDEWLNL
jgi:hypothetical protein